MPTDTVASPDPNDPFANPTPAQRIPDQPQVSDEDMIHALYEQYFKRMNAQAPVAPPPKKLKWWQNMNLNTQTPGPLQNMMMQRYLAQDPATRDYMQKKAAYDESQAQAKEMGPVLGAGLHAQATMGAANIRAFSQDKYTHGQITQMNDPEYGSVEVVPFFNKGGPNGGAYAGYQIVGSPVIRYSQPTPGAQGNLMQFPMSPIGNAPLGGGGGMVRPNQPLPPTPMHGTNPSLSAGPVGGSQGASGDASNITRTPGQQARPLGRGALTPPGTRDLGIQHPPPPQAAQEMQMLQQTTDNLTKMKEIMGRNAQRGGIDRGTGTLLSESGMSGRAAASYMDPDARDYQGRYNVVTGNMNSFQTGQNRLIVGEIPLIQANLPSFAEEPMSAQQRLDASIQAVERARQRMLTQYPSLSLAQQAGSQPQPSGLRMPRAKFQQLMQANPQGAQNFIQDGGEVY